MPSLKLDNRSFRNERQFQKTVHNPPQYVLEEETYLNECNHTKVAILLATYQGENYIKEQLDSIRDQTERHWKIWVSDDGSSDKTCQIASDYRLLLLPSYLSIHQGPKIGFSANFLSLTCNANIKADYYAYADQDDIWEKDKIARALQWLESIPADIPALYCSRTRLIDKSGHEIGLSPLFTKRPSFANALVQNIGGGNTMVFNSAARALLQQAGEKVSIISHDWWAYMLIMGCGGKVFYDPYPTVRYRQHDKNLVGMNSSWLARLSRIKMLWQGRFRDWNDGNISALESISDKLTPENQKLLKRFSKARQSSLLPRIALLIKCGIYRQTLLGNLGLVAAAFLGKL